jgi:hypothetical protein
METIWQDIRYGARRLAKDSAFTVIAIVTLAIGIGLNTAIFSVVNSVLLRPLPYKEPGRLVQVVETAPFNQVSGVSPNNFLDWRKQAQSFEEMAVHWLWLYTLSGTDQPTEIPGMKVSPNFFSLLGVAAQLGRTFSAEDQPDKSRVVVISHGLWQRRFGGKADAIGKTLKLDDGTFSVTDPGRRPTAKYGLVSPSYFNVWGFH